MSVSVYPRFIAGFLEGKKFDTLPGWFYEMSKPHLLICSSDENFALTIKAKVEFLGYSASLLAGPFNWQMDSAASDSGLIVLDSLMLAQTWWLETLNQIVDTNHIPIVLVTQENQTSQKPSHNLTPVLLDELPTALHYASQQAALSQLVTHLAHSSGERALEQNTFRKNQNIFFHFVEQSPLLIATILHDEFIYINQAGASMLGYSHPEELMVRSWRDFLPSELLERIPKPESGLLTPKEREYQSIEIKFVTPDGAPKILSANFNFSLIENKNFIHVIAHEVTEEKRIQEALSRKVSLAENELAIHQSSNLADVLMQLCITTTQALQVNLGACILLLDKAETSLLLGSSNIPAINSITNFIPIKDEYPVINSILKNKQTVVISDINQSEFPKKPLMDGLNIQSGLGIPLLVENKLFGLLLILDDHARQFAAAEIQFIIGLSNRAALAIAKIQYFQSLQESRHEAEEAARSRMEYLANMSHEFRAPLAAINHLSALLADTPLTANQVDYLTSIKSSTDGLLALIGDILDFARLEASKLELKAREFNLIQVIEGALDLIVMPASRKNLDLAYIIDEDIPEALIGDPNRLSQVLINLLTNAIKFTDSGQILVEVNRRAERLDLAYMVDGQLELLFKVQDTGVGIPKEAQVNLFKPFSQLRTKGSKPEMGTGLGLVICKQLVQLMKGKIWVESQGVPGKGSNFSFTIQSKMIHTPPKPLMQRNIPLLLDKIACMIGQPSTSWNLIGERLAFWGMRVVAFNNSPYAASVTGLSSRSLA